MKMGKVFNVEEKKRELRQQQGERERESLQSQKNDT
jgi:hypothetical protein